MKEKMLNWVEERFDLSAIRHLTREKTVPVHRYTPFYYFGGLALFFFVVQIVTGILLMLYYKPTGENAYESIRTIMTQVRFGWLIRSIHVWGTNLMMLAVLLHTFAKYFLKAYRKPRELTWISGFFLLVLALGFSFTGHPLPWNEFAYFAAKIGTASIGSVPLVGPWLLEAIRGGQGVTGNTISRLFALHVVVLPLVTIGLVILHLLFVQIQGSSVPIKVKPVGEIPFFPNFFLRDLRVWMGALIVLVGLATFIPAELGKKAAQFASAPAGLKPDWYFLPMYQILKWIPSTILGISGELIGIGLISTGALLILVVPFLDVKASREEESTWFTVIGVFVLFVFMLAITIYAKLY